MRNGAGLFVFVLTTALLALALAVSALLSVVDANVHNAGTSARVAALEREHAIHHPECPDVVDEHPLKPAKR